MGIGDSQRTIKRAVPFEGKDQYMNLTTYLLGSKGGEEFEILGGTHHFDFTVELPHALPASYEASHGHIRYHIEAALDVSWDFDKKPKAEFIVIRKDDLNEIPELRMPVHGIETKQFCCPACEVDPLIMKVTLPQAGYVPSQRIPVMVEYNNKSFVEVDSTVISLQRTICFTRYDFNLSFCDVIECFTENSRSQTPFRRAKIETSQVRHIERGGVESLTTANIDGSLEIPLIVTTSSTRFSKALVISYAVRVIAEVPVTFSNLQVDIPIIIGGIPLSSNMSLINVPYFPPVIRPSMHPMIELRKSQNFS